MSKFPSSTDLAQRIKDLTNSSSVIKHIPYEQAYVEGFEDMRRRVPDISLARELIDFRPKHDLDGILKSVIAYYKDHLYLTTSEATNVSIGQHSCSLLRMSNS